MNWNERKELTKENKEKFDELCKEEEELLKTGKFVKGVIINERSKKDRKRLKEIAREKMELLK